MDVHSVSFWNVVKFLLALSTFFVLVRLYTRIYIVKFFGVDDGLILVAAFMSIGTYVAIFLSYNYGLGKHARDIDRGMITPFFKLLFVHCQTYLIGAHCIRGSLVVLYRRLSVSPRFLNACWAYLVLNMAVYFAFFFVGIFSCRPFSAFWNRDLKAECVDSRLVAVINGWCLIALDLVAVLLPMPTVWKLPLPRRQKFWLVILFGLGFLVCIASYFRVNTFIVNENMTYEMEAVYGWTMVELTCGLIATSFVTFKPLILPLIPRAFRGTGHRSTLPSLATIPTDEGGDGIGNRKGAILNFTVDMILSGNSDEGGVDQISEVPSLNDNGGGQVHPKESAEEKVMQTENSTNDSAGTEQ